MWLTFAHLACIALGAALCWLWAAIRRPYDSRPIIAPRAELPPATARKLARDRRDNRLDLRPAIAAAHARRYISPPDGDFDREDTHG